MKAAEILTAPEPSLAHPLPQHQVIFNRPDTCHVPCEGLLMFPQRINHHVPVTLFWETAESSVHNKVNLPLDKWLASFPAFPDFSAEFSSCPRYSSLPGLALPAPSALSAKGFRQVHLLLFPIPCRIDLVRTLFWKDSINDKRFIDRRGPFLLPDNYTESLGCNFP